MSVFRRRRTESDESQLPPSQIPTSDAPAQPVQADVRIPAHIERALITLTTKMQMCVERLDALEHRVDELTEQATNSPSHSDVLEVRLHSAKLAAELARATVELRGEIGMASEEARRAARAVSAPVENGEVPVAIDVREDPAPRHARRHSA